MSSEVSPKSVENSPKSGEVYFMSSVSEASFLLQRLAEPIRAKDTLKTMVRRVAPLVGLAPSRIEGLWQGKARQVLAQEMDAIRAASRQRQQEEEAREELRLNESIIARIEALEAALRVRDPEFHGEDIAALVSQRGLRDRPLASDGD